MEQTQTILRLVLSTTVETIQNGSIIASRPLNTQQIPADPETVAHLIRELRKAVGIDPTEPPLPGTEETTETVGHSIPIESVDCS